MNEISIAIAARDEGINRVAEHNEELNAGWQKLAFAFLKQFAMAHQSFFPWEFVDEFERAGLVQPHDWRAVGQVYRRAVKERVIVRGNEIGKHPRRHAVAVLSWRSNVFKGAA